MSEPSADDDDFEQWIKTIDPLAAQIAGFITDPPPLADDPDEDVS